MWEDDPGLHCHCLDDALLHPAVSTIRGGMSRWDVFSGQCRELVVQTGLVGFDGEQVVAAAFEHQIVGVVSLRVQSVRRHHRIGEVVDAVAQGGGTG